MTSNLPLLQPERSAGGERRAAALLVAAVQALALARDLAGVMEIVRRAARELTGADGATFVLRDGDQCFYAEENAIAPLWKGLRFPMSACISGWVMLHGEPTVIPDIYADPRIPADAYRPTFVRSLAMVPIRTAAPIGAIGNYWATEHRATPEEVGLLQALADSTSIAIENVRLYAEMEQRVCDRTAQLDAANRELEAFSYSVSHDLRTPLLAVEGFTAALLALSGEELATAGRGHLLRIRRSAERMSQLLEDLLLLSRVSRAELRRERVNLSAMAGEIVGELRAADPARRVDVEIGEGVSAEGDPRLIRVVLENLLANAWKYTSRTARARIRFGGERREGGDIFVEDNGAGFDMALAGRLFAPFQRLHAEEDYPGTGIGLATVQRIVHRHGGDIRATAAPGAGATFRFTLP